MPLRTEKSTGSFVVMVTKQSLYFMTKLLKLALP